MAVALAASALWGGHAPAYAESGIKDRFALVIGNNDYWKLPKLANAANDARAMAAKLRGLGFAVTPLENVTRKEILSEVRAFIRVLEDRPGAVGLFYFAGHGLQVNNRNYLIGVEADLQAQEEVPDETVDADRIVVEMVRARNQTNFVILDACRDNPLPKYRSRGGTGGLAAMTVPEGARNFLISFAAAAGQRAEDGPPGGNGLYTEVLLEQIGNPQLPAMDVFVRTQNEVMRRSNKRQRPWVTGSPLGDFRFHPGAPVAAAQVAAVPVATPDLARAPRADEERDWAETKAAPSLAKLEWFVRRHPDGRHHAEATKRIAALIAERDEADRRQAATLALKAESDHWDTIKDSGQPDLLEAFLGLYPNSRYAAVAKASLQLIRGKNPAAAAAARAAPIDPKKQQELLEPQGATKLQPAVAKSTDPAPKPQAAALPRELPPLVTPTDPGEVLWKGKIDRESIEFGEGTICRSAEVDVRTRNGNVTGGLLVLDDKRRFDLDLSSTSGQRVAIEGRLPEQGTVPAMLVRLYDPLNLNFASYRFQGTVDGGRFAGSWRIDGYQCRGTFVFTRVSG